MESAQAPLRWSRVRKVLHYGQITLSVLILIAGIGDIVFKQYYAHRIYPGVKVLGYNIGGKTPAQAEQYLNQKVSAYSPQLVIGEQIYPLDPTKSGVSYNISAMVAVADQYGKHELFAPSALINPPDSLGTAYNVDQAKLKAFSAQIITTTRVDPKNATVKLQDNQPVVVPECDGAAISQNDLLVAMEIGLSKHYQSVDVALKSVPAQIKSTDLTATVVATKQLLAAPLTLTYQDRAFKPTSSEIASWVVFANDPQLKDQATVDQGKVAEYIKQIAKQIDIAPVNKNISLQNGVKQGESGGVNGLAVDQDSMKTAVVDSLMNQHNFTLAVATKPVAYKTVTNNTLSLDGKYIEVNLSSQHLWAYQDHEVLYNSPLTSGAAKVGLGTVTGLFSIYYKTTNTHLVGPGYDVAVQYWMPFYKGYGLHDAAWRNGIFGGPDYFWNGSHGCVNLPLATAAWLYGWAPVGTPVWVHN